MAADIPVYCRECNTRAVWDLEEVQEKAEKHEENLHDGQRTVRVPVTNDEGHTVLAPLPENMEKLIENLDMIKEAMADGQ